MRDENRDPPYDYETFYYLNLVDTVADMAYIGQNGNDKELTELDEIKNYIANLKLDVWNRKQDEENNP